MLEISVWILIFAYVSSKLQMRTLTIVYLFSLLSCGTKDCDFEFFESTTGISLLKNHELLDCPIQTDFSKSFVMRIHKDSINGFVQINKFKRIKLNSASDSLYIEMIKLRSIKFPDIKSCLILEGEKNKNSWIYLLDKNTGKLWGEITFPDWSGDW